MQKSNIQNRIDLKAYFSRFKEKKIFSRKLISSLRHQVEKFVPNSEKKKHRAEQ